MNYLDSLMHKMGILKSSADFLVNTGATFYYDTLRELNGSYLVKADMLGEGQDKLFFKIDSTGIMLISDDNKDRPDENWLREFRIGLNSFTLVVGDNPVGGENGGCDKYQITYSLKRVKTVEKLA